MGERVGVRVAVVGGLPVKYGLCGRVLDTRVQAG
jgi:hypothetical protein